MTKKIIFPMLLIFVLSSCSTFYNRSENKLAYFQIVYGAGFQNQIVFIMLNDNLHLFLTFAKSNDDFFPTVGHSSTYLRKGKNKMILKRLENRVQSQIYALPNPVDSSKEYIDTLYFDIGDVDSSNMFIDIQDGKIVTKIQKEQFRFYIY